MAKWSSDGFNLLCLHYYLRRWLLNCITDSLKSKLYVRATNVPLPQLPQIPRPQIPGWSSPLSGDGTHASLKHSLERFDFPGRINKYSSREFVFQGSRNSKKMNIVLFISFSLWQTVSNLFLTPWTQYTLETLYYLLYNTSWWLLRCSSALPFPVSLSWPPPPSPWPFSLPIPDWLPALALFWYMMEFFSWKINTKRYKKCLITFERKKTGNMKYKMIMGKEKVEFSVKKIFFRTSPWLQQECAFFFSFYLLSLISLIFQYYSLPEW